jgi:predicted nucleic acid-binding protein
MLAEMKAMGGPMTQATTLEAVSFLVAECGAVLWREAVETEGLMARAAYRRALRERRYSATCQPCASGPRRAQTRCG